MNNTPVIVFALPANSNFPPLYQQNTNTNEVHLVPSKSSIQDSFNNSKTLILTNTNPLQQDSFIS